MVIFLNLRFMDKKKNQKRSNLLQFATAIIIIICVNIISNFLFTRFDLTSEKRYTLSDATKKLLTEIDDIVYIKIYLGGDFPAGFKKLKNETREMLDEFRAYNKNIQYEFINPSESSDKAVRNALYQELMTKGLEPTNLQVKNKEGAQQQIIFPCALVNYKNKELPLQLLATQMGVAPEAQLNNSSELLEYNISNVIRKINTENKKKIGYIYGHGELDDYSTADIAIALSEYYVFENVKIGGKINSLADYKPIDSTKYHIKNKYDLIIIAKPDSAFDEKDKFIIDQFVMRGGKILWLIDPVFASMDSLNGNDETVAITNNLNLDDMFFKYGFRLNGNLIMDLNCMPIPIVTGNMGGQPQQKLIPWLYFPVLMPTSKHPIVNNVNAIKTEFISSIDAVGTDNLKKTTLLTSSQYSRLTIAPNIISLEILRKKPDESLFNKANIPVAMLIEGEFNSLFANRIPTDLVESPKIGFLPKSNKNKMIIIADGDIIKNQYNHSKDYPYPLGYDRYSGQRYGNKDFIMNAIDYLCDDSGLILSRTKEVKLRLLDKSKIDKYKFKIQIINILIPLGLLLIFGLGKFFWRRWKYTK